MLKLGIAELHKNPSILSELDEVATIINKKNREIKGFFFPAIYKEDIEELLKEIEYKRFLKRNKELSNMQDFDDEALLDGLGDES